MVSNSGTSAAGEDETTPLRRGSLTCRLLDLGVWLDEGYRIDAEPLSSEGGPDVR